ncbi:hypothetical protein C1932_11150 [Stenotrophomonas sp. YAU14D1_LEIMI4_1]|nr:hypothetical protein C1932_11150 [Stenotrophomonas sp. YAU14D1_LEIMI4_1]
MHFELDSKFSISVVIHPRMAWIYCQIPKQLLVDPRRAWMHVLDINFNRGSEPVAQQRDPTPCRSGRSRETVEGGAVSDCGVSAAWMPRPSPHGWVNGVPAIRHPPAIPRIARC